MIVQTRPAQLGGLFDSGDPYDRFIWWPNDVQQFSEQVQSEIWTVATDYSKAIAAGLIDHELLAAFKAFYVEWEKYFKDLGWIDYLNGGGTVKSLKAYRERLAGWIEKLKNVGAQVTAPPPPGAEGPRGDQSSIFGSLGSAVKWVAIGAVAIGGIYAISTVARTAGLFARPVAAAVRTNPRKRRRKRR